MIVGENCINNKLVAKLTLIVLYIPRRRRRLSIYETIIKLYIMSIISVHCNNTLIVVIISTN
jgi:hypothetical protein